MNVVNYKDIIIGEQIGKGASGVVRKCYLDGNLYCIKSIKTTYPKSVVSNIKDMTEIDFSKEYFTPLYIVESSTGDFLGYLMNYDEKLITSNKIHSLDDKLIFLRNAKKIIEKLHGDYKRIHGDLVDENMLFDELMNAFLLDFDSSLIVGQGYENKLSFRLFVQDYLKYYQPDKNMDIYTFNVTTLKMLSDCPRVKLLLDDIATDEFNMFQDKERVKELTKELLLRDIKKEYSGEYIIDYL